MGWVDPSSLARSAGERLAAAALLLAACGYAGTPGPAFSAPYDSVAPDSLLTYIDSSLQFDTLSALGDQQRLMLGTSCPGTCSYGPLVGSSRSDAPTETTLRAWPVRGGSSLA